MTTFVKTLGLAMSLFFVPSWLAAAVMGRVTTSAGDPVVGARVSVVGGEATATTDHRGYFTLAEASASVRVSIQHPRFHSLETEVAATTADAAQTFTLEPKNEVFETINVSATREGGSGFEPVSVAVSTIQPEDRPTVPSTLVALVEGAPGVAENGQGGQFQAYSIRGVAGQRVMTLVAGTRIVTERRAGSTGSFVDPLLLDRAEVVRGPFSSYYGSGALGGLVQVFPRHFDSTSVMVGYETEGDQSFQRIGFGWNGWSLGIAHRSANDGETPDGELLFNRFDQWSATVTRAWELENGSTLEFTLIPTIARDIGKPNADFPGRTTIYPEENHLISRLTLRTENRWRFDLWGHPNELITQDTTAETRALVDNDAFDYGLNAQKELSFNSGLSVRLGVDYFGRHGVQATERVENLVTGQTTFSKTLDGRQDEIGVYGSLRKTFGSVTLEGGGRLTWIEQANRGSDSTSKTAATGFIGLTAPLGGGFELVANAGTGFRFAGLSERFFSGTTGRGEVIANGDLDPERSRSVDLGVRYFGSKLHVELFGYRNDIDDYIERIRLPSGARTFVNLTSGTIEGGELSGFYQATRELRLSFAAQRARGEADTGDPLVDIPAARGEIGLTWRHGPWVTIGRFEHRFSKDRLGSGEQPMSSAELVSASLTYRFERGLELTVNGTNLLDETYLPSADELSVSAPGRSVGLVVGWHG